MYFHYFYDCGFRGFSSVRIRSHHSQVSLWLGRRLPHTTGRRVNWKMYRKLSRLLWRECVVLEFFIYTFTGVGERKLSLRSLLDIHKKGDGNVNLS